MGGSGGGSISTGAGGGGGGGGGFGSSTSSRTTRTRSKRARSSGSGSVDSGTSVRAIAAIAPCSVNETMRASVELRRKLVVGRRLSTLLDFLRLGVQAEPLDSKHAKAVHQLDYHAVGDPLVCRDHRLQFRC